MRINQSKKFSEFFDASEGVRKIDFLVLHHVQADNIQHALDQFVAHGVSSHFVIDESGEIFGLVDENDVAYHAGVSSWKAVDGLNKTSLGIEFVSTDPFGKKFEKPQLEAGMKLCHYVMEKYAIKASHVLGHSDIGYDKVTGFLDRKQDPSAFFDWKLFAENGIGIYPKALFTGDDTVLFKIGDEDAKIGEIKKALACFGYKIAQMHDVFDEEMKHFVRVFHRRFNQTKCGKGDYWYASSQFALNQMEF